MLKEGAFRAFRNLPIGWIAHANHARDRTERIAHHAMEAVMLLAVTGVAFILTPPPYRVWSVCFSAIVVHTVWWVVNGNCHVCLLDSFKVIKNAGIQAVLDYIVWSREWFLASGQVEAILVYGSFCRCRFHGRSDLDLRVIRKSGFSSALRLMPMAVVARAVSLLRGIPTDLQVVDSEAFLLRQMRADEFPVCVYGGEGLSEIRVGMTFEEVLLQPEKVLKEAGGHLRPNVG